MSQHTPRAGGAVHLPLIPGYNFSEQSPRYHRPQTLLLDKHVGVKNLPMLGVGGVPHSAGDPAQFRSTSTVPTASAAYLTYGSRAGHVVAASAATTQPSTFVPAHVAYDKVTLRWDGYFEEEVNESALETRRIRPVKLFYHMEDDTISISEPEVRNSGMPQGVLVRRQRLPHSSSGEMFTFRDVVVGSSVVIYGRIYHITNCDPFTRDFLQRHGLDVGEPIPTPTDAYTSRRTHEAQQSTRYSSTTARMYNGEVAAAEADKLGQFLANDGKVLRFDCVWDDRDSMFGDKRPLVLHYFLADDTLQLRQIHLSNDGRDRTPCLVSRQACPRPGAYSVSQSLVEKLTKNDCYTASDLALGATLNIFGRLITLQRCDAFTRDWLAQHFPHNLDTGAGLTPSTPPTSTATATSTALPPPTGFGSHEDSLGSVRHLVPRPPRKDLVQYLESGNSTLRFQAHLDCPSSPLDQSRRFIVSLTLRDDLVSVYEQPQRNSGFQGGLFLQRARLHKPGSSPSASLPSFYHRRDFTVGARILISGRYFVLSDADDATKSYLAQSQS